MPSWRACTGARVTAFVQPGDMALAAALLPPLTPARLKVAAAGAVELLALGDADALLVAHGARARTGMSAWPGSPANRRNGRRR